MKVLIAVVIVAALVLLISGSALAWQMFHKSVDGQGRLEYTGQVEVTEIRATSMESVRVTLTSTPETLARTSYSVELLLDGVSTGTDVVSWANNEIPDETKSLDFVGLDLSLVALIDIDVTH